MERISTALRCAGCDKWTRYINEDGEPLCSDCSSKGQCKGCNGYIWDGNYKCIDCDCCGDCCVCEGVDE